MYKYCLNIYLSMTHVLGLQCLPHAVLLSDDSSLYLSKYLEHNRQKIHGVRKCKMETPTISSLLTTMLFQLWLVKAALVRGTTCQKTWHLTHLICYIIHNNGCLGTSVVHGSQTMVALLTSCVPNFKLDCCVVQTYRLSQEGSCKAKEPMTNGPVATELHKMCKSESNNLR